MEDLNLAPNGFAQSFALSPPEESDLNEIEWLRAAATNPAFDFLKNPQEDIYTLADGDRFVDRSIKPQHTRSGESQWKP
ncbi:MAG: hypothetical protein U9N46_05750 [Euryarchaeota archaeon]|nr:hypothetical protein [Euryarchaeota archaeon]